MVRLDRIRVDYGRWTRDPFPLERAMFADMIKSIKEVGVANPIMIEPDLQLIDGLYRVEAARQAGLTEIPAIVRDDLTLMNKHHRPLGKTMMHVTVTLAK